MKLGINPNEPQGILPVAIGVVTCSLMTVGFTTGVAHLEFHYAKWTRAPTSLPVIAEAFRPVYWTGWLLPLACGGAAVLVTARKLTNVTVIAFSAMALGVAHLGWFLFALLARYLANQSFDAAN